MRLFLQEQHESLEIWIYRAFSFLAWRLRGVGAGFAGGAILISPRPFAICDGEQGGLFVPGKPVTSIPRGSA